jgi:hypothetical protein
MPSCGSCSSDRRSGTWAYIRQALALAEAKTFGHGIERHQPKSTRSPFNRAKGKPRGRRFRLLRQCPREPLHCEVWKPPYGALCQSTEHAPQDGRQEYFGDGRFARYRTYSIEGYRTQWNNPVRPKQRTFGQRQSKRAAGSNTHARQEVARLKKWDGEKQKYKLTKLEPVLLPMRPSQTPTFPIHLIGFA